MEDKEIVDKVLGEKLENAQKICKEHGFKCNIVREDLHNFVITCDYRLDRVNVEIDEGKITKSYIG
jgi:hypothetical protein